MINKNEIQTQLHLYKANKNLSNWGVQVGTHLMIGYEYLTFYSVLFDAGINNLSPDRLLYHPDAENCFHEIRITGLQSTMFLPFPVEQMDPIRYELFADAWYGKREIFSNQLHPEVPNGINFIEKLEALGDFSFDKYMFARSEYDPKAENPEKTIELSSYIETQGPIQGQKISDYQIRLFYDDPNRFLEDLVSAFQHINARLCKPFELIIEK